MTNPYQMLTIPAFKMRVPAERQLDISAIEHNLTDPVELVPIYDHKGNKIERTLGVYNSRSRNVVAVVPDTYCLLPNSLLFDPIFSFFKRRKIKYVFDRFCYVTPKYTRIMLTFPELSLRDDTSEGLLTSLWIQNSYNRDTNVFLSLGALRLVCLNGMVINDIVKRIRISHQTHSIRELVTNAVQDLVKSFFHSHKAIQGRLRELFTTKATVSDLMRIDRAYLPRVSAYAAKQLGLMDQSEPNPSVHAILDKLPPSQVLGPTKWDVYNLLTNYFSHAMSQQYRYKHMNTLGRLFGL